MATKRPRSSTGGETTANGNSLANGYQGNGKNGTSGELHLPNPHLDHMEEDMLYHFAISTKDYDLYKMFHDVKFVIVGGSARRMKKFADFVVKELKIELPAGQSISNIAENTDRYALYKAGPVLLANHGIGAPSFSCMMHELIKLLYHAHAQDVIVIRTGTCGGLGVKPGTVIVTETPVDPLFNTHHEVAILGKLVTRPAILDQEIIEELLTLKEPTDDFDIVKGATMCTLDFYEGQGRLDGAFCDYTEEDKMAFLHKAHKFGVRNIEMEALIFAAMCHRAGLRGVVVCAALLDRLQGDQVLTHPDILHQWENRPADLIIRLIKKHLNIKH